MKDGTNINQRDIFLVLYPFSDLSGSKKRPVLILSKSEFNKRNEDVICCLITSNLNYGVDNIGINNKDLENGNLEFESMIKPYNLFYVNKSLIYKKLGKLNAEKFSEVYNKIINTISL
ncbi:MAG: type II toxin-antitoxin system PemK/MazF family toxin [archaeon]